MSNRIIAFRAWDGKKMYDPMPIIDFELIRINGIILMQSTGLFDKNGTEVYEGDVFKWGIENDIGVVIFKDGCFVFNFTTCNLAMTMRDHKSTEFEIIGNIYEHPHLINK